MTEKKSSEPFNKCLDCPRNGMIGRFLARTSGLPRLADDCEGPVHVSRGQIVTQLRYGHEPSPPQKTWNSMTGPVNHEDDRPRRYSRTDWTSEDVCGRDEEKISPHDGEVPYMEGVHIRTNHDGSRVAAFVKGDQEDISSFRSTHEIMDLLDSADDMVDAFNTGDIDGMQDVQNSVQARGFSIDAIAGRGVMPRRAVLTPDHIISQKNQSKKTS